MASAEIETNQSGLTNKRNIVTGLVFFSASLLIALNFFQMSYVGGSGDADLLWNANEGYLFVHGGRRGYRISYLGYLAEMIKESLYLAPSSDDSKPFTLIFHITPFGVKRSEIPAYLSFTRRLTRRFPPLRE